MSGTGLRTNTGTASAANRNFYGLRNTTTGELVPLKRAFGSISKALDWLFSMPLDPDAWETVDLRSNPDLARRARELGMVGLPKELGR